MSLYSILDDLANRELLLGMVLIGAGVVFIWMGFRMFAVLIAASFGIVGFLIGGSLPVSSGLMQLICSLVGAAGLALASTLRMKLSVALLAGVCSGLGCMIIADTLQLPGTAINVCGIVAMVVAISLTFVMYHEIIAYVLSLEGSVLFLGGLVVVVSHSPKLWAHFRAMLVLHPFFGIFLVLAGTITGFYLQIADLHKKESGLSV